MKTRVINVKLQRCERQTTLNYDDEDKCWIMDTTVMKHYRKALAQKWQQIEQYIYADDGSVCGGKFKSHSRGITIRSAQKQQKKETTE